MSNENTVTLIAPDFYGPIEVKPGMTVAEALETANQDANAIVKLQGDRVSLEQQLVAGSVYLVAPANIAKGGFDGGQS